MQASPLIFHFPSRLPHRIDVPVTRTHSLQQISALTRDPPHHGMALLTGSPDRDNAASRMTIAVPTQHLAIVPILPALEVNSSWTVVIGPIFSWDKKLLPGAMAPSLGIRMGHSTLPLGVRNSIHGWY
jgi:hypothetical protein